MTTEPTTVADEIAAMRRIVAAARAALKEATSRVITIQGDVAEVIAGSGRAASAKSRAYGGLTQLADHLRAAVDALDGAS